PLALGGFKRRELRDRVPIAVALLHHLIELQAQGFGHLLAGSGRMAADQPADESPDREADENESNDGRVHDRDSPGTESELYAVGIATTSGTPAAIHRFGLTRRI